MSEVGFPAAGIGFLADLAANNNRAWFKANAARYREQFQQPAEALLQGLQNELETHCGLAVSAKIFRLARDLRFAADKTPYHTYLRMGFYPWLQGRAPQQEQSPLGWYLSLEPHQLMLGCGRFVMPKTELEDYRHRLQGAEGDALARLTARAVAQGCRQWEPELKQLPPGFPKDYPHPHLARCKSISLWRDLAVPTWLHQPGAAARLAQELAQFQPLWNWLQGAKA